MSAFARIPLRPFVACAALLALGAPAAFADVPESAVRTVSLAVDFCGAVAGGTPEEVAVAAARVPGLKISEPMSLEAISDLEDLRAAFRNGLTAKEDDKLQVAAFSEAAPTIRSRPFAVINPKTTACLIAQTTEDKATVEALNAKLAAEGSAWSREGDLADGIPKWSRPATFGDRAFLAISSVEGLTRVLTGIEERPLATPEQVANHVRTATDTCITGIIDRKPADAPAFAGAYAEISREKHPKHPDIDVVRYRSTMPGPISVLEVRSMNGESLCVLFTSDAQQPGDAMLADVTGLISGIPLAKPVKIKAKGDVPAHQAWRVRRPGNTRTAELSVERDDGDEHIVIVTISRHGWFLF